MASANEWSDLRLLIRDKCVQKYLVHQKAEFVSLSYSMQKGFGQSHVLQEK